MNPKGVNTAWASFGRQWGGPIVIGTTGGLLSIIVTLDALVVSLGSIAGGMLASFSGIGLGLLMSVVAALIIRLIWPMRLTREISLGTGDCFPADANLT